MAAPDDYEEAWADYRRVLHEYGEALKRRDPASSALFDVATAAWAKVRSFQRPDGGMEEDLHLVGAFSVAIIAGASDEAKRLYEAMGEKYRLGIDTAETLRPGTQKIWLR